MEILVNSGPVDAMGYENRVTCTCVRTSISLSDFPMDMTLDGRC
jgi:hypothetical protein